MVFLVSGASKKFTPLYDEVAELIRNESAANDFIRENVRGQTGITAWISTALKIFWKDERYLFRQELCTCYRGSPGDFCLQRRSFFLANASRRS